MTSKLTLFFFVCLFSCGCFAPRMAMVEDGNPSSGKIFRSYGELKPREFKRLGIRVSLPGNVKQLEAYPPELSDRNGEESPGLLNFTLAYLSYGGWLVEDVWVIRGGFYVFRQSLYEQQRASNSHVSVIGRRLDLPSSPANEYYPEDHEPDGIMHRIDKVSPDGKVVVAGIFRYSYEEDMTDASKKEEVRKQDEAMIRAILESIEFIE